MPLPLPPCGFPFAIAREALLGLHYLTAGDDASLFPGAPHTGKLFAGQEEVVLAHALGKLTIHEPILVRLPARQILSATLSTPVESSRPCRGTFRRQEEFKIRTIPHRPGSLVRTTPGRVLFNEILPPQMPFYNLPVSAASLARVVADARERLEFQGTADLLSHLQGLGLRTLATSGVSVAVADLKSPAALEQLLQQTEREIERYAKQYQRGNITERERHNKVLDLWQDAAERCTDAILAEVRGPGPGPSLHPVHLLHQSGVGFSTEKIARLSGISGLALRPDNTLSETPVRGNFRNGLSALEYFMVSRRASKDRATAAEQSTRATALFRTLVSALGDLTITSEDCRTSEGVCKSAALDLDGEGTLAGRIRGRVSARAIQTLSAEFLVRAGEVISPAAARRIEESGIDRILVRSPLTCRSRGGVCRRCYGATPAGALVQKGARVGRLAAAILGETAARFSIPTVQVPGVICRCCCRENEVKTRLGGLVRLVGLREAINARRERIALTAGAGEVGVVGPNGRLLEVFPVPHGAILLVAEGQAVRPGAVLCRWDVYFTPLLATQAGRVRLVDLVEGQTLRHERNPLGAERWVVLEHQGELHPAVAIEGAKGEVLEVIYLPARAFFYAWDGMKVEPGTCLAQIPRELLGYRPPVRDSLARLTEIGEARTPAEPAVLAQVGGLVEVGERRRGLRTLYVIPTDDRRRPTGKVRREHTLAAGRPLRVQNGDLVGPGDRLCSGNVDPHETLEIVGPLRLQAHLLQEAREVFRSQGMEVDDRHLELLLSRVVCGGRLQGISSLASRHCRDNPPNVPNLAGTFSAAQG